MEPRPVPGAVVLAAKMDVFPQRVPIGQTDRLDPERTKDLGRYSGVLETQKGVAEEFGLPTPCARSLLGSLSACYATAATRHMKGIQAPEICRNCMR